MPALWQASQRPMYVRTVWVDGFRHAILTNDDPHYLKLTAKKRRPHSSAGVINKPNSRLSNADSVEDCLRKFNLVVKKDFSVPKRRRPISSKEFRIEKLDLTDVDNESEEGFLLKASPQPLNDYETFRSNFSNFNMRNFRANRTSRLDVKENTDLSDRVLQWLDLAGKVDLLAPENAERMSQPRHSWPEIQRRNHNLAKSKTAIDVRAKETVKPFSPKICDGEKSNQIGIIDRHDFYLPTSANTIEQYARQSRNIKCTPRETTKTKDYAKTKGREPKLNVAEARQKIVSERSEVQKQYADLVSKKLIPDLQVGTKKQVHIFMPEVPKKSNPTSRTESLLSQKS
ncbi:unnamed protein product [Diatraea saccharalis]|uniref:Uncharacterized protein n=1 Tax=Diatraea saccharalis TaxID=40085 RepID=A0A9N9R0G2_9NEOP|nr:unnamed protein product [Diatraea saccharalis]